MSNATVTPGVLYTYSDAYQATIGSRLVVEYTSTSNAITYGNFTSLSASPGAWSPASVTFVPPANTVSVRVFHLIEGVGSLTLDDVSLSAQ